MKGITIIITITKGITLTIIITITKGIPITIIKGITFEIVYKIKNSEVEGGTLSKDTIK